MFFPLAIYFFIVPLGGDGFNFIILGKICMIFRTLVTANVNTNTLCVRVESRAFFFGPRALCRKREMNKEEKIREKKREMIPEPFYVWHFSCLIILARRHQMETVRMNELRRALTRHVGMPNARVYYVVSGMYNTDV